MKKLILFCLPLYVILFSSCKNKDTYECKTKIKTTSLPTPMCYMLCDFSQSQDTLSFEEMKNNTLTVFSKINKEYSVKLFDIRENGTRKAFFDYSLPEKTSIETPKQEKKREKYFSCMLDSLKAKLEELSALKKSKSTCIIDILDALASEVKNDMPDKDLPVKIVILSDMLEDCCGIKVINSVNAARSIENRPVSNTFSNYKAEASLVLSSKNKQHTSNEDLLNFWKRVFDKYRCAFDTSFTMSLPLWVRQLNAK